MLQELTMVEQRHQAVREVLDGGSSGSEVSIGFGVDRGTLHRWPCRYVYGGLGALASPVSQEKKERRFRIATEANLLHWYRDPTAPIRPSETNTMPACRLPGWRNQTRPPLCLFDFWNP